MGKILSIIIGTACVVLGVVLIFVFSEAFLFGLQFLVMLILILGGLIALIAGISEIKDSLAAKKEEEKKDE